MKKMTINGNSYINELRKPFMKNLINTQILDQVVDFAYEMCFGVGHHRHHRTGGQINRKAGEQFCNTFQGKLAEVVLRNYLINNGLDCGKADFGIYGKGIWDDSDLIVNEKSLSIKSAAFFSNLLLLESKDYDENGNYIPNLLNGTTASYDYYVLVRIKPDIKKIFRDKRWFYSNSIDKTELKELISQQEWCFDIAGWISHEEFVEVIRGRNIIPQNALLNGKTRMDAENYYIQSGDMHDIIELCKIL